VLILNKKLNLHSITKLFLFIIGIVIILFSNPYIELIILHFILWKTFINRNHFTLLSTIVDIFLNFINIFCGKLILLTKLFSIFVYFIYFLTIFNVNDLFYFYEKILYKNRRSLKAFLMFSCYFDKVSYFLRNSTFDNFEKLKEKVREFKISKDKIYDEVNSLYMTYRLRLYQSLSIRNNNFSTKISWYDFILAIFSVIIFIIVLFQKWEVL